MARAVDKRRAQAQSGLAQHAPRLATSAPTRPPLRPRVSPADRRTDRLPIHQRFQHRIGWAIGWAHQAASDMPEPNPSKPRGTMVGFPRRFAL
jgi:hypothetical protein